MPRSTRRGEFRGRVFQRLLQLPQYTDKKTRDSMQALSEHDFGYFFFEPRLVWNWDNRILNQKIHFFRENFGVPNCNKLVQNSGNGVQNSDDLVPNSGNGVRNSDDGVQN